MTVNVSLIIALVTFSLGAITKAFFTKIPERFIPLQNLIIGFISALVCLYLKIEPNFITALVACLMASMSAGGTTQIMDMMKKEDDLSDVG